MYVSFYWARCAFIFNLISANKSDTQCRYLTLTQIQMIKVIDVLLNDCRFIYMIRSTTNSNEYMTLCYVTFHMNLLMLITYGLKSFANTKCKHNMNISVGVS